jgi:hypothetical protein
MILLTLLFEAKYSVLAIMAFILAVTCVLVVVWGPLMAGFGNLASGTPWTGTMALSTDPSVALFGLAGLATIFG